MVIKGADLEVAPSDYLTWFFERQLLPSRETDELFIDADNPEDVITRGEAKEYAQRIGYALRKEENIGADGPGRDVITMFSSNQVLVAAYGINCR
jgi:4-coumarate--CoA ligase